MRTVNYGFTTAGHLGRVINGGMPTNPMNLDQFKDTLGDKFESLQEYVSDLQAQRDAARKESIDGRKTLKAKAAEQEVVIARMLEKLGVQSPDDLDSLPDGKGQAEAAKQLEARIKRAERERDEAIKARETVEQNYRETRKQAAIAQAVSKHQFTDPDIASMLIERGVQFEGDEMVFRGDGGKLIPIDEAAAWIASTRPTLVKAQGGGGSGYRDGGPAQAKNPWAKDTLNLTEQIMLTQSNPQLAAQMKAAAGAN